MNYWTKKHLQRRRFLAAGGAGALGLAGAALVGCGGDSDDSGEAEASPATGGLSTAAAPTAVTAARQGGQFVTNEQNANADHLDIQQSAHPGILTWGQFVYDGLMELDEPTPGDFSVKPMLIESWEQPDNQTLLLKVRKGVKFQNVAPANGRTLTSKDILFSLNRMRTDSAKFPRRSWFAQVDQMTATDDYTIRITTKRPHAAFLTLLAHPWTVVIDSEAVKLDGDQIKTLVGTGPFIARRAEIGVQGDFQRNPDYWQSGKPYVDSWKFLSIPDKAAEVAAFRAGQINLANPNADVRDKFRTENPEAREVIAPGLGIHLNAFNVRKAPFNDPRVRQAITNAIDIPGWMSVLINGDGLQTGPMPSYHKSWAIAPDKLPWKKPNIQKAKELLKAAGLENGFKFTTITIPTNATYVGQAIQMQADLKAINVEVTIQNHTGPEYTNRVFVQRDFESVSGQDFSPDDPDQLGDKFLSTSPQNWCGYSNAKVDELFEKQSMTLDLTQRKALVEQLQTIMLDEVATIWTFISNNHYWYSKNVQNMRRSPMNGNQNRYEARNLFFSA